MGLAAGSMPNATFLRTPPWGLRMCTAPDLLGAVIGERPSLREQEPIGTMVTKRLPVAWLLSIKLAR